MKTKGIMIFAVVSIAMLCWAGRETHVLQIEPYDPDESLISYETIDLANILRIDDGQIQTLDPNEGWVCCNDEVRSVMCPDGYMLVSDVYVQTGWLSDVYVQTGLSDTAPIADYSSHYTLPDIYDPNQWTIPDTWIEGLAKSGRVCEALGEHCWGELNWRYKPVDGFAVASETEQYQECVLCGKTRTLEWNEE